MQYNISDMENKIKAELEKTNEILLWAHKQDISGLKRFLEEEAEKPLICIGSGGSFSICKLISLMYSTRKGLGTAITPYSIYSISEEVLKNCKILLVSNSGHNKDITSIAKKCVQINPDWTANLTTADGTKNDLKKIISPGNSFNYESGIKDGFISLNSVTANYALALKAFKGDFEINFKNSEPNGNFDYQGINHYIVLYGGWGEPAALDFESKMVETGIATCAISDYRNFCHGRFIFAGNHCGHEKKVNIPNDCVVVMIMTPREASFAEKIKDILPERCSKIIIETFADGAAASLEFMLKASELVGFIASQNGINPMSPPNHGPIDKLKPIQIPFISDLKKSGPLSI